MKCPLCDQDIKREIEEITEVGKKGIIGLVNASKRRNDNKHKHFQSATKLFVHTSCRKDYTRSETISKDARVSNYPPSEPGPSTSRISTPQFNFKICCFFCSKSFEDETKKPIEKRRIVHSVTTLNFQDRVKEVGLERNDVWGNNVFERLNSAYDLVAEEAKYHKDCHTTFMRPIDTAESDKQPSYLTRAFQEVRTYMENSTDCQFSQAELLGIITGEKPQWRWIKLELERTYGDRILVTPGSNRHDLPVICFRDTGLKILSASWYEQKSKNITDEKIRIVQMAANIIRQDIQSQVYSKETYPPSEDFLKNPGSVANSLTVFLETLLKNKRNRRVSETKRKSVALGNAITAIVRPRSFVSPLLARSFVSPPQNWGWTMKGDVLVPNQTEDPPAPEVLLKTIFCRCMKDCSSGKCSCRKAMLSCTTACSHCQGSCLNGVPLLDENEDEDDVSPLSSPIPSTLPASEAYWCEDEDIAGPSNPKRPRVSS